MTTEHDDDFPAGLGPDDLAEVAELLALGPSDVIDEEPPPSLWAGIEARLGSIEQVPPGDDRDERQSVSVRHTDEGSVVDLGEARSKRRFRVAVVLGAIAAAFLVAVPLVLAVQGSSSDTVEVAAAAELDAIPIDFVGSGEAEVVERELRVETTGLDPLDDAVYELWLLDVVDGKPVDLVSIGVIEADGSYTLDEGIDLERFNVVDISIEPTDGDPTHSGNSVLRGQLEPR